MDPIGTGRHTDEQELCKQSVKHQYILLAFHRDARVTSVLTAPTEGVIRQPVQAHNAWNRAAGGFNKDPLWCCQTIHFSNYNWALNFHSSPQFLLFWFENLNLDIYVKPSFVFFFQNSASTPCCYILMEFNESLPWCRWPISKMDKATESLQVCCRHRLPTETPFCRSYHHISLVFQK